MIDCDGLNVFINGNTTKLLNDKQTIFLPLFIQICDCFYASRGSLELKQRVFNLLSMLLSEIKTQHQDAEAFIIQRVIDYMKAHLSEPLSLADLASVACMSQRTFCRRFQEYTGLPPIRYHRTLRIQKSKLLLQNKLFSAEQIAIETGFTDAAHFYRCFQQIQGESVKEARKRMQVSIYEP